MLLSFSSSRRQGRQWWPLHLTAKVTPKTLCWKETTGSASRLLAGFVLLFTTRRISPGGTTGEQPLPGSSGGSRQRVGCPAGAGAKPPAAGATAAPGPAGTQPAAPLRQPPATSGGGLRCRTSPQQPGGRHYAAAEVRGLRQHPPTLPRLTARQQPPPLEGADPAASARHPRGRPRRSEPRRGTPLWS